MRKVVIESDAEADMLDAFRWYESQRQGLGEEFLLAIEAALAAIRRHPESFSIARGTLRRARTRRFPYGIYFAVEDETISVLAVLHAKRGPGIWKRRTG